MVSNGNNFIIQFLFSFSQSGGELSNKVLYFLLLLYCIQISLISFSPISTLIFFSIFSHYVNAKNLTHFFFNIRISHSFLLFLDTVMFMVPFYYLILSPSWCFNTFSICCTFLWLQTFSFISSFLGFSIAITCEQVICKKVKI